MCSNIFMKLIVLGAYLSYFKGQKDKGYTNMIHNGSTLEWEFKIGCDGWSVAMVTHKKGTFS